MGLFWLLADCAHFWGRGDEEGLAALWSALCVVGTRVGHIGPRVSTLWPNTDHSVNEQQFLCLTNDLECGCNRAWVGQENHDLYRDVVREKHAAAQCAAREDARSVLIL